MVEENEARPKGVPPSHHQASLPYPFLKFPFLFHRLPPSYPHARRVAMDSARRCLNLRATHSSQRRSLVLPHPLARLLEPPPQKPLMLCLRHGRRRCCWRSPSPFLLLALTTAAAAASGVWLCYFVQMNLLP
jgi:hypothetical protein